MKILRSKSKVSTVALVHMLTIAATLITFVPIAVAQEKLETFAYISVSPKTIGVDQTLLVNLWVVPLPPCVGFVCERYYGYAVVFTDPDEITDTRTLDSYGDGTAWFTYVPDKVGTWSVKFTWAGDETHEPCESPDVAFTVQQDPIPSWPPAELPPDYWERPISGENREWYEISGDWPQSSYNASEGNYNPYSRAPNSAHILWKQPTGTGGIIGGESGSLTYGGGSSPYTIIAGRAYYNAGGKIHCIDIRTGEELWAVDGSATCGITRTEMFIPGFEQPFVTYAPTLLSIGTRLQKYDASTGALTLDVPGMSGTFDNPYVYSFSDDRLIKWTTTGSTSNFANRIIWNASWPYYPMINHIWGDAGMSFMRTARSESSAFNTTTGEILWHRPAGAEEPYSYLCAGYGKSFIPMLLVEGGRCFKAFDIYTGKALWTSELSEYPWGPFWAYSGAVAYGNFYTGNYDGHIYCFDAETGKIKWKYYSGDTTETPYNTWPFFSTPAVADGKIYMSNAEHTFTLPLIRGMRLHCVDAYTGKGIWNISGSMSPLLVADGYLLGTNYYDAMLYCFGKGQTATTVSAPQTTISKGSGVLIEGTVLDQSPAQPGTPCVSKESMTAWMEHLHMQKPAPGIGATTGVPVDLRAISSDGSVIDIGRVTSDSKGCFMCEWTPTDEDLYTVTATFNGDESYYGSWAETGLSVGAAPPEPTEPAVQEDIDEAVDSLTPLFYGIIVAVVVAIVIGIVNLWGLRKRA
jgi:outer membrane protein assembly factor BamB